MEKKQLERKITFPLKNKISLITFRSNHFILFDFENLSQKYVKIPDFVNSVRFIKENNTFHLGSHIKNARKLDKWSFILLNYPKSFERPFRKQLTLKGLGYKGSVTEDKSCIELKLGFSHLISFNVPKDVSVNINKQSINLEGFNKTSVGNLANTIRKLRLPDSYKGKGVWYKNEVRVLKELKKK